MVFLGTKNLLTVRSSQQTKTGQDIEKDVELPQGMLAPNLLFHWSGGRKMVGDRFPLRSCQFHFLERSRIFKGDLWPVDAGSFSSKPTVIWEVACVE